MTSIDSVGVMRLEARLRSTAVRAMRGIVALFQIIASIEASMNAAPCGTMALPFPLTGRHEPRMGCVGFLVCALDKFNVSSKIHPQGLNAAFALPVCFESPAVTVGHPLS